MIIDDVAIARAVHILAIVHWIGGVAAVTTIVLPRARAIADAREALAHFEAFERRFANQVRVSVLAAGVAGFYMLWRWDAWYRLHEASFWWLHLMIALWSIFALMLFVLEPLVIHRLFHELVLRDKEQAFAIAIRLHWVALTVSLATIAAGVIGSHGTLR